MERSAPGARVSCVAVGHRYGRRRALSDVSWSAGPGVTAIVGRNGAGKSTLLRAIVSLLRPTEGRVTVDGHDTTLDPAWVRRNVGYLPQDFIPFSELTVREFLEYIASLAGIRRRDEVERAMRLTHLEREADTRTGRLSGGTRRRLGLAQALLGEPRLLVVDEPTTGLDPEERVRLRQLLASLATTATVLLSTHLIEDVAAIVERVIVLDAGSLHFDGTATQLAERARGRVHEVAHAAPTYPDPRFVVSRATPEAGAFRLRLVGPPNAVGGQPLEPTLEDGYLALIGAHREAGTSAGAS